MQRAKNGRLSFLTGGQGEVVLLLHGIPGSAKSVEPLAQRLATRYRVIVPDLLGFGQSEPAGDDYHMHGQAQEIARLLHELRVRRFHLVAHDYGGPVGLTLMRQSPSAVSSVTLASTNVLTDAPIPFPLRVAKWWGLRRIILGPVVGMRWGLAMIQRVASVAEVVRGPWADRGLTRQAAATTYRIFIRSLADLATTYRHVEAQAGRIRVPALVLWGDADPFFPVAVGRRVAAVVPGARFAVLRDCGHFGFEECPDRAAELVLNHLDSCESALRLGSAEPPRAA